MESGIGPGQAILLRPAHRSRSRSGRWLTAFGAAGVVVAVLYGLSAFGASLGDGQTSAAPIAVIALALIPLAIFVASAIVGRRWVFARFFEREEPYVTVDAGGLTLVTPRRGHRVLVHNEIGGLRRRSPLWGRWVLVDRAGSRLTEIPASLITARDARSGRSTSLATAMARARPDRYVALQGRFELQPLRFRLRGPDEAETDWAALAGARRRLQLVVLALAVVAGAIVGYALLG